MHENEKKTNPGNAGIAGLDRLVARQSRLSKSKKCDYDAGMPCNLLKSHWRMVSVLRFWEVIEIAWAKYAIWDTV
jgi:hypothetical protein